MFAAIALMAVSAVLGCNKQAGKEVAGTLNGANESPATNAGRLKDAEAFASLLAHERFEAATRMFDPALAKAMDAKTLETAWRASAKRRGAFRKIREVRRQPDTRRATVMVTCEFEQAVVNLEVRFASTGGVLTFYLHYHFA